MKKIIALFTICLFITSCKSKKNIVSVEEINKDLKVKEIIEKHKHAFPEFKTLSGNVLAVYNDGSDSQSISLSFRMEKDKAIWFSAPLGIAKAYITPQRASYYNRLDNTYFDGDFSYISKLLGFEVNFENLQNLLLGQSVYLLTKDTELLQSSTPHYVLESKKNSVDILSGINAGNFRIGFFDVQETSSGMKSKVEFTYQEVSNVLFPNTILINVNSGHEKNMRIELEFSAMKINENVSFPFKIPSGTKEIK
ncbi:MAG: DUF4292 domain-containing protein [Capnocytophaga sp.]|nr:DUF4292 domain-containing protein [Capnocytophaga sp.]